MQKEIGLDYGFWDDRIRGSIGYYQKKVDNLLYSDPVPYSSSFSSVTQNIGSLKNKGFEFDVKVDIIKNTQKDLTWDFDFNVARNITTLEKLNSEGAELMTISRSKWEGKRESCTGISTGDV